MSNTPSDEEILALAQQHLKAFAQFTGAGEVWFEGEVEFARAIEAEARRRDTEIIQQMLYVIEAWERGCEYDDYWRDRADCITAARKRLENT